MSNTVDTGYEDTAFDDLDIPDNSNVSPGSLLDSLREEGKKRVSLEPISLKVPGRPDMVFTYDVNIDSTTLDLWRKRSTTAKRGRPSEFDGMKFAKIILAAQCQGLTYKGMDTGFTFTSPELMEMFGASSYFDCIKFVYGNDADIFRHGNEVVVSAGYGDQTELEADDEEDDPTNRS